MNSEFEKALNDVSYIMNTINHRLDGVGSNHRITAEDFNDFLGREEIGLIDSLDRLNTVLTTDELIMDLTLEQLDVLTNFLNDVRSQIDRIERVKKTSKANNNNPNYTGIKNDLYNIDSKLIDRAKMSKVFDLVNNVRTRKTEDVTLIQDEINSLEEEVNQYNANIEYRIERAMRAAYLAGVESDRVHTNDPMADSFSNIVLTDEAASRYFKEGLIQERNNLANRGKHSTEFITERNMLNNYAKERLKVKNRINELVQKSHDILNGEYTMGYADEIRVPRHVEEEKVTNELEEIYNKGYVAFENIFSINGREIETFEDLVKLDDTETGILKERLSAYLVDARKAKSDAKAFVNKNDPKTLDMQERIENLEKAADHTRKRLFDVKTIKDQAKKFMQSLNEYYANENKNLEKEIENAEKELLKQQFICGVKDVAYVNIFNKKHKKNQITLTATEENDKRTIEAGNFELRSIYMNTINSLQMDIDDYRAKMAENNAKIEDNKDSMVGIDEGEISQYLRNIIDNRKDVLIGKEYLESIQTYYNLTPKVKADNKKATEELEEAKRAEEEARVRAEEEAKKVAEEQARKEAEEAKKAAEEAKKAAEEEEKKKAEEEAEKEAEEKRKAEEAKNRVTKEQIEAKKNLTLKSMKNEFDLFMEDRGQKFVGDYENEVLGSDKEEFADRLVEYNKKVQDARAVYYMRKDSGADKDELETIEFSIEEAEEEAKESLKEFWTLQMTKDLEVELPKELEDEEEIVLGEPIENKDLNPAEHTPVRDEQYNKFVNKANDKVLDKIKPIKKGKLTKAGKIMLAAAGIIAAGALIIPFFAGGSGQLLLAGYLSNSLIHGMKK